MVMKPWIAAGLVVLTASAAGAAAQTRTEVPARAAPKIPLVRSAEITATARIQDPNSPTVSELVVKGEAPVPKVGEGAPMFAREDLASAKLTARKLANDAQGDADRCKSGLMAPLIDTGGPITLPVLYREQYDAALKVIGLSDRASEATGAAAAARAAAFGSPTPESQRASEVAELARQNAVNAFIDARESLADAKAAVQDLIDLMSQHQNEDKEQQRINASSYRLVLAQRKSERQLYGGTEGILINRDVIDLSITGVKAITRTDSKGVYLEVSGVIGNPRDTPVRVPPISITALDPVGFKLTSFTADPVGKITIPPKSRFGFSYDYRPQPKRVKSVFVTFGDVQRTPSELPASYLCRQNVNGFPGETRNNYQR